MSQYPGFRRGEGKQRSGPANDGSDGQVLSLTDASNDETQWVDAGGGGMRSYQTVDDLKLDALPSDGERVRLLGYYAANDGGGQELEYFASGFAALSSKFKYDDNEGDRGFHFKGPDADDYFRAVDQTEAHSYRFGITWGWDPGATIEARNLDAFQRMVWAAKNAADTVQDGAPVVIDPGALFIGAYASTAEPDYRDLRDTVWRGDQQGHFYCAAGTTGHWFDFTSSSNGHKQGAVRDLRWYGNGVDLGEGFALFNTRSYDTVVDRCFFYGGTSSTNRLNIGLRQGGQQMVDWRSCNALFCKTGFEVVDSLDVRIRHCRAEQCDVGVYVRSNRDTQPPVIDIDGLYLEQTTTGVILEGIAGARVRGLYGNQNDWTAVHLKGNCTDCIIDISDQRTGRVIIDPGCKNNVIIVRPGFETGVEDNDGNNEIRTVGERSAPMLGYGADTANSLGTLDSNPLATIPAPSATLDVQQGTAAEIPFAVSHSTYLSDTGHLVAMGESDAAASYLEFTFPPALNRTNYFQMIASVGGQIPRCTFQLFDTSGSGQFYDFATNTWNTTRIDLNLALSRDPSLLEIPFEMDGVARTIRVRIFIQTGTSVDLRYESAGQEASYSNATQTWTISGHRLTVGMRWRLTSIASGTAYPTGFNATTSYHVIAVNGDTFQVAETRQGDPVATSDDGDGTYYSRGQPGWMHVFAWQTSDVRGSALAFRVKNQPFGDIHNYPPAFDTVADLPIATEFPVGAAASVVNDGDPDNNTLWTASGAAVGSLATTWSKGGGGGAGGSPSVGAANAVQVADGAGAFADGGGTLNAGALVSKSASLIGNLATTTLIINPDNSNGQRIIDITGQNGRVFDMGRDGNITQFNATLARTLPNITVGNEVDAATVALQSNDAINSTRIHLTNPTSVRHVYQDFENTGKAKTWAIGAVGFSTHDGAFIVANKTFDSDLNVGNAAIIACYDTAVVAGQDQLIDLGSPTYQWKDGYFSGTVNAPTLLVEDLGGTVGARFDKLEAARQTLADLINESEHFRSLGPNPDLSDVVNYLRDIADSLIDLSNLP